MIEKAKWVFVQFAHTLFNIVVFFVNQFEFDLISAQRITTITAERTASTKIRLIDLSEIETHKRRKKQTNKHTYKRVKMMWSNQMHNDEKKH